MDPLSDEALLVAYRDGDSTAFELLFERYRGPLFHFLLRRVGDRGRAEELYQDVWLRVIERCDEFRGDARFSTWLYTIARNRSVDHRRRMKLRAHLSLDQARRDSDSPFVETSDQAAVPLHDRIDGPDPPFEERLADPNPSTEQLVSSRALEQRVAAAVERLPDDQQEVFLLRQLQGLRFEEIAEVVEVPVNTVKSRMRYALHRLRQELGDFETKPG